jgi:hypothetical protein
MLGRSSGVDFRFEVRGNLQGGALAVYELLILSISRDGLDRSLPIVVFYEGSP